MRIPKYYKQLGWQRFIAGVFLGMVGGWVLFMILSGAAHEQQLQRINTLEEEIKDLKRDNKLLVEDEKEKTEQLEKKLTVQKIQINFPENSDLKEAEKLKISNDIETQLSSLVGKNIETVKANNDLIYLIQNKEYQIEKDTYEITVKRLILISSTLEIIVNAEQIN